MKQFRRLLLLAGLVGLFAAPGAWANARFSILGAATYSNNSVSPSSAGTINSKFVPGYGGAAVGIMMGRAEFELSALYLQRKWTDNLLGSVTNTASVVQIPLMFRYWFAPSFSLEAGGYGAVAATNITQDSGGTGTYASYGFKPQDFGVSGGAVFAIPVGSAAALTFNARYNFGLSNSIASPSSTVTYNINEILMLVGFRFGGMMGK